MKRFFGRRKIKETKEGNSDNCFENDSDVDKKSKKNKTLSNDRKIKKVKSSKRKEPGSDVSTDSDVDSCLERPKSKNVSEKVNKADSKQEIRKKIEDVRQSKKVSKNTNKLHVTDEGFKGKTTRDTVKPQIKSSNGRKQKTEKNDKKIVEENTPKKAIRNEDKNRGKDTDKRKETYNLKNNPKVKTKEDVQKRKNKKEKKSSKSNKEYKEIEYIESSDEGEEDADHEESDDTEQEETESEEDKDEESDLETDVEIDQDISVKRVSKRKIPLESQAKFYQDRAVGVEKHYGQFCQLFGSITRKMARTRDKGDLLSKQLLEYAKQEKISHSTSKNLKEFAHNLAAVQDYRDAEIRRLESKVVKPMSAYGSKCKTIKQLVKREQGAINREIKQRKNLDKVRDKKPGDAHSISAAETEVKKAAESAQIGIQGLQNQMCTFEKEKLTDLKNVLADFVSIELVFHAKAIEFYSKCFDNLAMIDEDMDLEEFKRKISLEQGAMQFGPQAPVPQGTITSVASEQMMSTLESTGSEYTSTGASYTYTYGDSTMSTSGEKRVRIQTVGQSMYADDDDDDDEDDDDDDDYEEDEVQNYSRPIRR